MSTAVTVRDPRACVSAEVWDREVRLIMRDRDRDREMAERIFGQAVAYLVVAGENPDVPMGPTPIVDEGVHSFMLDTPNYFLFCDENNNGRYIHHIPHLPDDGQEGPLVLNGTIKAIRAAGFPLDAELWNTQSVKCNQCYAGCHDSPDGK
ncbi:hypothetical protein [Lentzea albidocapillata]|uniref:Uncharacterized protein n=1 Tax=Lentzea albidocapillata TaxID=40571 RepID=A0A1W2DVM3_9PSEU|nr:hypothetical protein [Lentzea albidocapillata]SMD01162.1 hypothetical protein SAMN05660733_03295 [Lentzea albidocapillata]